MTTRHVRVVSASVRGEVIYQDGVFSRPDLIAKCHAALVRPVLTIPNTTHPAPRARAGQLSQPGDS